MNIERDSEDGLTLHLSASGREGVALCGREAKPTDLAITCWKRHGAEQGEANDVFCEVCDSLKNG